MTDSTSLAFPSRYQGTLCHPDGIKSCGGCCGLYNDRDADARSPALAMLKRRTLAWRRDVDVSDTRSLLAFRKTWAPQNKLLEDLPTCAFVGLVDMHSASDQAGMSRIGCLAHPLQNDGVDGRDCGVYDREICEDYLCASHQLLREHEKWLVIEAIDDSYLYGLVVTDVGFVRELFIQTGRINRREVHAPQLHPGVLKTAEAYFRLKVEWPYRDPADGIFGQFHAGEGLETPRRLNPARSLGSESPWDTILRHLGTHVETLEDLETARSVIAERVQAFADELAGRD